MDPALSLGFSGAVAQIRGAVGDSEWGSGGRPPVKLAQRKIFKITVARRILSLVNCN